MEKSREKELWRWSNDRESIIATFLIDASINLMDEMISNELFEIILNELATRETSIFALKIKARSYHNQYAGKQDNWSKLEHQRMMKLQHQFSLDSKPKSLQDIANDMLILSQKGVN